MKLKYYLRGLGLGIIFTCLILSLFSNNESNKNSELNFDSTETISAVDDYAVDENENQNELDGTVNNKEIENDKLNNDISDNKDRSDNNDLSDYETNELEEEYFNLTVEKGDIARDIAERLYDDGIVDDAEAFRKYLGEVGVANKLHAGEYKIKYGSTYEEIVEVLK